MNAALLFQKEEPEEYCQEAFGNAIIVGRSGLWWRILTQDTQGNGMPWIREMPEPCFHPKRPELRPRDVHKIGSIWQCDDCEEIFYVVEGDNIGRATIIRGRVYWYHAEWSEVKPMDWID